MVAAGALAHSDSLNLWAIVGFSIVTFLFADLAWYDAGRRHGDRMLHFVCGLSKEPGACVHKATSVFSKHGIRTLLFSKFVIGLDALAAPLAGNARVSAIQFLIFDGLGAMFWTAAYIGLGYVFRNQLDLVAMHLERIGTLLVIAGAGVLSFYLVKGFARWYRFIRAFRLARITPEELHRKLKAGEDILLVDMQGGGHRSAGDQLGIPGAVRINPHALEQYKDVQVPPLREVVLYCNSLNEFISARVALALRDKGVKNVRPLAGGLKAWRECGFPVTFVTEAPTKVATSSSS